MAQLGPTLIEVFGRAGIKDSDPRIAGLLQNEAIFKATIDDAVANEMLAKLMNDEIATQKLVIPAKSALAAEIYNGQDEHLKRVLSELKVDEAEISEIMKADKTPKKMEAAIKKVNAKLQEALEKAGKKGDSEAEAKLRQEIADLRKTWSDKENEFKTATEKQLADLESERIEMHTGMRIAPYLDRLNFPDEVSADEKRGIAMNRLAGSLSEKKLRVVLKDKKPVLINEAGTEYFDPQNRPVSFEAFAEQSLAPILKKAPAAGTPGAAGITIPGAGSPANSSMAKILDSHLNDSGVKVLG